MNEPSRNLYLLAGIRGGYEPHAPQIPIGAEVALLHALDHRWGIRPPWGACDSRADLVSPGGEVLRGWAHVDLRVGDGDPPPSDVPISGLLRSMWDSLEIFGTPSLTGVDVILPVECAGDALWSRVAASILRAEDRTTGRRPRVLIEAGNAWTEEPAIRDVPSLEEVLSDLVDVRAVMDSVNPASYPASPIEHPFVPSNASPFRAEVMLAAWTIDDAAWLAEVASTACQRAGVTGDVQLAVRLLERPTE